MTRLASLAAMLTVAGLIASAAAQSDATRNTRPAAQPTANHSPAAAISVPQCRVLLIDELTLASERAGVLDFVVTEGTSVEAGTLVAHTRDTVVRAAMAIAEQQALNDIEVRFARKATELAQLEYERDLTANRINADTVPDSTVREHRLAAEKSLLQLEQAEHNLEIARLRLSESKELLRTHRVEAPFAALVRKVFKKSGETVREGDPIVELVATDRLRVEGYVSIADLPRVKIGSQVQVRAEVPDAALELERQVFPGRIAFIDVKVEPVSNRVKVWAEVQNRSGHLRDGLSAVMLIDPQQVDADFAAARAVTP